VRRSPYLVNDTLLQIQNASANNTLKRPLKVQFIGEQGVDEGGVQKVLPAVTPPFHCTPCAMLHSSRAALQLDHLAALQLDHVHQRCTSLLQMNPQMCIVCRRVPLHCPPCVVPSGWDTVLLTLAGPAVGIPALFLQHHSRCQYCWSPPLVHRDPNFPMLLTTTAQQPITSPVCWPVLSCFVSSKLATNKMTPK